MNRKDRRAKKAKARQSGETIDLSPGSIVTPVAGTTRWVKGKASGVWGRDIPLAYMLDQGDGRIRPLTKRELAFARRMYRLPELPA